MSDIILVLPALADEGQNFLSGGTIFCELKSEDGRLGKHQRLILLEIQRAGGIAIVSQCMNDGEIKTWQIQNYDKKNAAEFTTFFYSKDFKDGWWIRKVLEAKAKESSSKRLPTGFFPSVSKTTPDA